MYKKKKKLTKLGNPTIGEYKHEILLKILKLGGK